MRYKVFRRNVICDTFKDWWKAMLWCHLVIKVFPRCHDFESDCFTEKYAKDGNFMRDQLSFLLFHKKPTIGD